MMGDVRRRRGASRVPHLQVRRGVKSRYHASQKRVAESEQALKERHKECGLEKEEMR